jgi:hypothetical protein
MQRMSQTILPEKGKVDLGESDGGYNCVIVLLAFTLPGSLYIVVSGDNDGGKR